jgi:hypothetical protein
MLVNPLVNDRHARLGPNPASLPEVRPEATATNWTHSDPGASTGGGDGRHSLTPSDLTLVARTSESSARLARGLHTRSGASPIPGA